MFYPSNTITVMFAEIVGNGDSLTSKDIKSLCGTYMLYG